MSFLKSFSDGDLAAGGTGPSLGGLEKSKLFVANALPSWQNRLFPNFTISFPLALRTPFLGGNNKMFIISDIDCSYFKFHIAQTTTSPTADIRFSCDSISTFFGGRPNSVANPSHQYLTAILMPDAFQAVHPPSRGFVPSATLPSMHYIDWGNFTKAETFQSGREYNFVERTDSSDFDSGNKIDLTLETKSVSDNRAGHTNFAPFASIHIFAVWSLATITANPSIPWDNMSKMRKLIYPEGGGPVNGPGATGSDIMGVQPDVFLWGGGEDPLKNDADGTAITVTSNVPNAPFPFKVVNTPTDTIGTFS